MEATRYDGWAAWNTIRILGVKSVVEETMVEGVDAEWLSLIWEAKQMGIAKELIREFLRKNGVMELMFEK